MSTSKDSKQRKKRKRFHQAPLHRKNKYLAAHLSPELRERFNKRSLSLRKGDRVQIMRGDFKGMTGEIKNVNTKKLKVFVENITRRKMDGSETNVAFKPSNLMITEVVMDDKKRRKIIERVENE